MWKIVLDIMIIGKVKTLACFVNQKALKLNLERTHDKSDSQKLVKSMQLFSSSYLLLLFVFKNWEELKIY